MRNRPFDGRGQRAFTLVELLVVIVIIQILVAMLLPTMTLSRLQAYRVTTSSNIHQLSVCFSSYAADSKSYYPYMPTRSVYNSNSGSGTGLAAHAGCFSVGYWGSNASAADMTIYNCVDQYGAMTATGHPSLGTPTWDHSSLGTPNLSGGSTGAYQIGGVPPQFRGWASPYALFFGFNPTYSAPNGLPWTGTSAKVDGMSPNNNLVGDRVTAKFYTTYASYWFPHSRYSTDLLSWNDNYQGNINDPHITSNVCDVAFRQNTTAVTALPANMVGAYMGKADGAVIWYPVDSMVAYNWSSPAYSPTGLYFKNFAIAFGEAASGDF